MRPLSLTFRSNGEIFGVDRRHEGHEDIVITARDIVIAGILAKSRPGDRAFAAERAVRAIIAESIPGAKVKLVPRFRLDLIIRLVEGSFNPVLVGIFGCDLRDPFVYRGRSMSLLARTKGLDQFPKAPSTNLISISATRAAALSISARTVR